VAYEQRAPLNYLAGTLSTAAALSDTTISSTTFTTLATTYSTTQYLPLVLHDPSAGVYEIVWVTGHTTSSPNVTVARGREGSTARAWPTGTQIVCAPTVRDVVGITTRANLPTDAHYGARYLLTDETVVVERVLTGWRNVGSVGNPADIGGGSAPTPPAASLIQLRAGTSTGTTDSSGNATATYRTAFPTNTIAVVVTSRYENSEGPYVVYSKTKTGFGMTIWNADVNGYTRRITNATYTVDYIAVGY
jgi:hypothetical protein